MGGIAAAAGPIAPPPDWTARMQVALQQLDARQGRVEVGVYVRDLDSGQTVSHRATEPWYLASMVKVPVAMAVLRNVERGLYTLDTPLRLRAADHVDGAGATNHHAVGTPLTIRFLMEQMIIHSDNTASDMLIGLVGLDEVNALVASVVPWGWGRITSLADVRRQVYGQLTPKAMHLGGRELLLLRAQRSDAERLRMVSLLTGTPPGDFRKPSLEAAYNAYYASGLNAGQLDAYGELLARLADGLVLSPASTDTLLALMGRVQTGAQRIRAGLPADAGFAHKTGTQRRRICDAGLVRGAATQGPGRRVVVVACVRGELSLQKSERALRAVGLAVCESGVLGRDAARLEGSYGAENCPVVAAHGAGPVPPGRSP